MSAADEAKRWAVSRSELFPDECAEHGDVIVIFASEVTALEAERDALRAALLKISALDYSRAALNGAAYHAVQIARAALEPKP